MTAAEFWAKLVSEQIYPAVAAGVTVLIGIVMTWLAVKIKAFLDGLLTIKHQEAARAATDDAAYNLRSTVEDVVKFVEQRAKKPETITGYKSDMTPAEFAALKKRLAEKRLRDQGIEITPEVDTLIEAAVLALGKAGG